MNEPTKAEIREMYLKVLNEAPAPSYAQTTARPPAPALGFITAASCNASAQAGSTPLAACRQGKRTEKTEIIRRLSPLREYSEPKKT